MATVNSITETIALKVSGTAFSASMTGSTVTPQNGANFTEETQTIATSATALAIGTQIVTLGYLMIKNTDATNYVDIATDDAMAHLIATIKPGKCAYIPSPGGTTALWAKANTAAVQIVFLAVEA
jgi:hypothetical protein